MPPIDDLTQQSLREFGLLGTLLLLILIFGIVYLWKRPPPPQHASPIQAVDEKAKLIPLILEETRNIARDVRDMGDQLEHIETRLERMETLGHIIKDRQHR